MIGEDTAELILKRCNVHWIRSYQRVAEKVISVFPRERDLEEQQLKPLLYLHAKHIMLATEKQHVLQLFNLLHDTGKLSLNCHLKLVSCV